MFQKAAVLLAANALLMTSAQVWEASTGRSAPYLLSFLVYAFVPLYCCRFAARDYYLFCTKGSSFWEMPGSLGWLKRPRNTALAVTTTLVLCLVAIGMFPSPE